MSASRIIFGLLPRSGELLELVGAKDKSGSINILCRVHLEDEDKNAQKRNEREWNQIIETVLKTVKAVPKASCHICKSYFLKGDRMVFGWSIQLTHRMPRIFINILTRAFDTQTAAQKPAPAPPGNRKQIRVTEELGTTVEIEDRPLKGGVPPTSFRRGKGAYPVKDVVL